MVEVSNNFKQECEANVGAYKFGKIKVNYIDDNPLNYEQGAYSSSSGAKIEDNQSIRSVNLVECKPSFKYKIELGNSAYKMKIITYTEAQAFIATHDNLVDGNEVTTEATAKYLSVTIYSTDILEGTSILLNGTSRNGALTGAELEGNTSQNGTPTPSSPIPVNNVTGEQVVRVCGKNLMKLNLITTATTYSGVTFTPNDDGTITLNGTATSTRWVDLSNIDYGSTAFNLGEVTNTIKSLTSNDYTMNAKITSEKVNVNYNANNKFTSCYIYKDTNYNNAILQIQLEKGSSATSYEEYQGKDYEINLENIELNKIGNYQDFIRKGTGKNLVEPIMASTTLNGVTCTNNGDGSFTLNGTATASISFRLDQSTYNAHDNLKNYNGTYTLSCSEIENGLDLRVMQNSTWVSLLKMINSNTPVTATVDKDNCFIYINVANGKSVNNLTIRPMLEKSSSATYYEPYGYKDKWYIEKNVLKLVVPEAVAVSMQNNNKRVYVNGVNLGSNNILRNTSISQTHGLYCDILEEKTAGQTWGGTQGISYDYDIGKNLGCIDFAINGLTTVAEYQNALKGKVIYAIANTPEYTLIENEELIEQLDAVSHAETQEGITNILVAGNLPATLEIERDLTDSIKGRQLRPFIGYSITGDDDLISFKITGKADSSKSFIGSCVTKQIDLEIFNAENKHNLENKQIIVSTGMAETAGNSVTFEPFTITGTKDNKTKDKINYVGYDDMYKLNTAYVDTNTYGEDGITLYSFLESLASNANTSLGNESIPNGDFIVDGNPFTNNETNMFALSQVAKLSGGFAEIGRDNKIYIKTLDQDTPTMTLDTNLYSEDFEKAENFGAVNKVVVGESNISGNEAILSDIEDIELNGEHVVEILDSYFLSDDADKQIICAELFERLKGLYYLPFSATCNGFPYLDLGDVIEIEDKNGDTYLTYLLNYELSYNGGYKEKIGAEAQSSTETKYKNVNTIKDKFKQVEIIVDKANAQIQSVIKKSDDNYTSITQTIGGITTQVQTATTTAGNAMTAVGNLAQGTQRQFTDLTEALSRLSQSVNNIQALFRVTGGANLIQNSVGFFQNSSGAPTMWNVSQGIAGFKHGYDSELLGQTTSQGKFYIRNGTISTTENDATLETEANISGIETGSLVTLSFKYKQSADSTTTITLTNGETTFFTATFSEEVEDWTSYSDEDNTNSFICTTDSLVLTITNTSTYNTDDQGFMISDLILNYGEAKTWELHSGESYGGVIQLSSQGISVKSSSANTITYMTSDGIEVFETTQGDVLGDLITKLTSNGIETKDFVATGDITTRNLITTMIKDTSNNDIYIEYIKDE